MSKELGELIVRNCTPDEFKDCDMVFSGLDSDVAGDIGTSGSRRFAQRPTATKAYIPYLAKS